MAPPLAITLLPRAERDLRALEAGERKRIADTLRLLAAGAENLDIKALKGAAPWLRLRVGDYRVICRRAEATLVITRIVDRRDLELAVSTLKS